MDSIEEYLNRYLEMFKPKLRRTVAMKEREVGYLTPTPKSFIHSMVKEKGSRNVTEEIFNEENNKFCSNLLNTRSGSPFKTPPPSFYPSDKGGFLGSRLKKSKDNLSQVLTSKKSRIVLPALRKKSENSEKVEQILKNCEDARNLVIESSGRLKFFADQDSGIMKLYAKKVARTSDVLMQVGGHSKEILKILYEEYKKSDEFNEKEKVDLLNKIHMKTVEDYKAKTRNMKRIMMSCRQKIKS